VTAADSTAPGATAAAPPDPAGAGSAPYPPEYPPEAKDGVPVLWIIFAAVLFIVIVAVFAVPGIRHWVAFHTGTLHGGPDPYYNFWSGFGSDLGEATLISAVGLGVYTGVRKVNCHTKGCWRIGKHALHGTPYVLCRHHHPGVPSNGASHAHILEQHRRYLASKEPHST
jgi:hypothetical protein